MILSLIFLITGAIFIVLVCVVRRAPRFIRFKGKTKSKKGDIPYKIICVRGGRYEAWYKPGFFWKVVKSGYGDGTNGGSYICSFFKKEQAIKSVKETILEIKEKRMENNFLFSTIVDEGNM